MIGFWKFFLDNRAFTYFLMGMTLVAGVYAIMTIPKESSPEVNIPIATISTSFFGASAEDVELLVTDKIENAVESVSDVSKFTSSSNQGFSTIVVEFEQDVDIDEKVTRLKEATDNIKGDLPTDGNDPRISKVDLSAQPIMLISLVSELPPYSFQQVVDQIESEIEAVAGVSEVRYAGIPEREISVILDNRKLVEKNLDYQTVVRQLSGGNSTQPVGSLSINQIDYPLDLKAEIKSYNQLQATPIGSAGVSSLVITDVATLFNGYKDEETITRVGFTNTPPSQAVNISVLKKQGGDITKLTKDITQKLEALDDTTLKGVDWVVTYDAGSEISRNLSDLTSSGLQTIALVFIVLLFAVGFREALIAGLSIPLSFLMAFVAFIFVGNTINFISLFALILSIGILVDTAIVVVEGINRKIQEGMRRQDAALATIKEFGLPLIAGTMTTVAVFFPLLFLSGIIGQFIRGIPYTVILVLLSSLFVSLAFVTVLCAALLKNREHVAKDSIFIRGFKKLEVWYEKSIHYLLHHSVARRLFQVGIVVVFFLSIGLVAGGFVKVEFFPAGDLEYAYVEIELDPGATLQDTSEYAARVEKLLLTQDYVESFVTTAGETSIYSSEGTTRGDKFGNITINIDPDRQSEGITLLDPLKELISEEGLFKAETKVAAGGPPTGSPIDIEITSGNNILLEQFATEVEDLLNKTEGPIEVASTKAGNTSGIEISVDRNAAYRFGVTLDSIATAIRGATNGIEIFTITENQEDVPVVIKNQLDYESTNPTKTNTINPETLYNLSVLNNRGETILLGSIISVSLAGSEPSISHNNGKRTITVTAELEEGINPNEIRARLGEQLADIVPQGVEFSFGGEAAEQDESFMEIGIAFLLGVFLMFSILILQFGHWRQTVIVLSVLPFAFAGVILGLFVSGSALSFPAMLGLIALAGIVVNNSIILVTVFNQLRVEHPEWSLEEVVSKGAALRLRPVVVTTITTVVGVTPLLAASAIWAPIAYAIMYGLSFCIVVTLALIPLVYRRFEGFREGTWNEVGNFWMTVALVLLLPIFLGVVLFSIANQITGSTALAVFIGLLVVFVLVYVFTHIRKHK